MALTMRRHIVRERKTRGGVRKEEEEEEEREKRELQDKEQSLMKKRGMRIRGNIRERYNKREIETRGKSAREPLGHIFISSLRSSQLALGVLPCARGYRFLTQAFNIYALVLTARIHK